MKATLKPTDQPDTFGIVIDDITVEEAVELISDLAPWGQAESSLRRANYETLRPVLEAGIAVVRKWTA